MKLFAPTDGRATECAEDWRDEAVCADLPDVDLMFPDPSDKNGVAYARRVCAGCTVRDACLTAAIAVEGGRSPDSRFGIWAGTTPGQRYHLARGLRGTKPASAPRGSGRAKSPCGTPAAYDRHCRDGEEIDDDCRAAHNEKNREKAAQKRAARAKEAA